MHHEEKSSLPLWYSFPKPTAAVQSGAKYQTQTEGHSTKFLTDLPRNYQDHEKQGKTKKLSETRGP